MSRKNGSRKYVIDYDLVVRLSQEGLSQPQIARIVQVPLSTFEKYKFEDPLLNSALEKGKATPNVLVEQSLLRNALGFTSEEKKFKRVINFSKVLTPWFKQIIKNRDENKCQNPNCPKKTTTIDVFHIDYNTEANNQYNLITLCTTCKTKALNSLNKEAITQFYNEIIALKKEEIEKQDLILVEKTVKKVPGNVSAIQIWLQANWPTKYRARLDLVHSFASISRKANSNPQEEE